MSFLRKVMFTTAMLSAATAWGQSARRDPQIGYVYPAGAQRGTTARIAVGGQYLTGPASVHISGPGVHAKVVRYLRPTFNIMPEQRYALTKAMIDVRQKRLAEAGVGENVLARLRTQGERSLAWAKRQKVNTDNAKMPDHLLLIGLADMSLRELGHARHMIFFPRQKQQINRQLMETVLVEVTADADAAPGDRELRIRTRQGLTNPMMFQVGQFPEVSELEPNDRQGGPDLSRLGMLRDLPQMRTLLQREPVDLPAVLNGQIMPGDADRFLLRAKKGQPLVIRAHARRLNPYLADAVPGWFQATVALYDAKGNEVAYADDFGFDPDPVLLCRIPRDGLYELAIRDAIHRGRQDFVYRIEVAAQPFITRVFPLGGRQGEPTRASIDGWNLATMQLTLDTAPGGGWLRHTTGQAGPLVSNAIPYAVDTLPECREREPNDRPDGAQPIKMPMIVNGRIGVSGDVDVFRIDGSPGQRIVVEVSARRLNSPLDSLVRLTGADGKVLQWNDDHVVKDKHLHMDRLGLATHHADSYLMAELPAAGAYYVQLSDSQHHGGEAHAYRVRISRPIPDFALRATPSSLSTRPGGIVPLTVYALRRDGFEGAIDLRVTSPAGFTLQGGRIPAGHTRAHMTLTAPPKAPDQPVALVLEGVARIGGATVRRPAQPADNVMQAFLYRHLLPAQQTLVAVTKQRWPIPPLRIVGDVPVRIPVGGSMRVRIQTRRNPALKTVVLQLRDPPAGVTLHDVKASPEGIELRLAADKSAATCGLRENVIVEAFQKFTPKGRDGKPIKGPKRLWPMGFLPAIPIEIVAK